MFALRAQRAQRPAAYAASDAAKRRLHATIRMLSDALLRLDQNHPSLAIDEIKHARIALTESETHITVFEAELRSKE
jgi:hypothetical protein